MKYLFKRIIRKFFPSRKQKYLFKQIKPGDIVYASMPLTKQELKQIPDGHRKRPYLIVEKNRKTLTAYQCSSKLYKYLKPYEYFPYKQIVYEKNKDSYFILNKTYQIPIKNIINKFDPIIDKDKREIERRLCISLIKGNHNITKFKIKVQNEIGDIIVCNKAKHLIYQKDHTYTYTYLLTHQSINKDYEVPLYIEKRLYYVQTKEQKIFKSKKYIPTIYLINKEVLNEFNLKKEQLRHNKQTKKNHRYLLKYDYDIGTTIINNFFEKYVYLYSINDKKFGIKVDIIQEDYYQVEKIRGISEVVIYDKTVLDKIKTYTKELIALNRDPHHVLNNVLERISLNKEY